MNDKYTKGAVVLHWVVAIGILLNLWIGLRFDYTPKDSLRDAINFHKSVGITVLGFALLRVLWRATHVGRDWRRPTCRLQSRPPTRYGNANCHTSCIGCFTA